jgi:hypothetical protein
MIAFGQNHEGCIKTGLKNDLVGAIWLNTLTICADRLAYTLP